MNAKTLFAAILSTTFAVGAFAQEATADDVNFVAKAVSSKTRAEVRAELEQARNEGTYIAGGEATIFADAPKAGERTRAEVRKEGIAAAAARRNAPVEAWNVGA